MTSVAREESPATESTVGRELCRKSLARRATPRNLATQRRAIPRNHATLRSLALRRAAPERARALIAPDALTLDVVLTLEEVTPPAVPHARTDRTLVAVLTRADTATATPAADPTLEAADDEHFA